MLWLALQALLALVMARMLRQPRWWLPLHLMFFPALGLLWCLHWPRYVYGGIFGFLTLVYWSTFRTRVPLYLTHRASLETLMQQVAVRRPRLFADLGCGTGTVLCALAERFPDARFVGWEVAPLPWLWAKWTTRHLPNCRVHFGSFWHQPLHAYDMVYAFLSPVPMPELWRKAQNEMNAGAWLVSNSFAVPDVQPWQVLDEGEPMPLYVYRCEA